MVLGRRAAAGIAVVSLGLAVAGVTALRKRQAWTSPAPASKAPVAPAPELVFEGRVEAAKTLAVPAPAEGFVEAFLVAPGDEVFAGQLLARMGGGSLASDREQARAEAERARTRVNDLEGALAGARLEESRSGADAAHAEGEMLAAEKVYLRQKMLVAEGATPRLVFEKAAREDESAKSASEMLGKLARQAQDRALDIARQLGNARAQLAARTGELETAQAGLDAEGVRSPVDGVVVARRGQPGDAVSPAMGDLFEIATDPGALKITIAPGSRALAKMRAGQAVRVRVAEAGALPATVTRVEQGQAVVEFRSPSPAVRPGLTALVDLR